MCVCVCVCVYIYSRSTSRTQFCQELGEIGISQKNFTGINWIGKCITRQAGIFQNNSIGKTRNLGKSMEILGNSRIINNSY